MENSMLESLVSFMLPSNILSRFTVVKVESNAETLFIHLDEIASAEYVNDPNITWVRYKNNHHLKLNYSYIFAFQIVCW